MILSLSLAPYLPIFRDYLFLTYQIQVNDTFVCGFDHDVAYSSCMDDVV